MENNSLNVRIIDCLREIATLFRHDISGAPKLYQQLSMLQVRILAYLYEGGKHTNTDVSKAFAIEKSTSSIHLRNLEKLGMIRRTQDKSDRRIDWIVLSQKARKIMAVHIRQKRQLADALLTLIPETDRRQLLETLSHVQIVLRKKYETNETK